MCGGAIYANGLGKRSKLKRFEMIKLKKEVNKSAIMRELRKEAEKMYENSWEREYTIEKFMEGAESLFNLLRLPVVGNSSKNKTNKKEPTTPYSEWCKKLKDV
jgi:aryl-phospho-beta-D-glucosidase BglC (GH1 family)